MDTNNERWVTVATAARLLGKSERTIRRWERDGKLAADRAGTAVLVDIARHMPDTEAATPSGAAAMPDTTGEQRLLTEQAGGRPRRFRWPWQRREG